jgi:hypothetical protein
MVSVPFNLEAHWKYPYNCCHSLDCGPIVNIMMLPNGDRHILIKISENEFRHAIFPKNFESKAPLDERNHACITWQMGPLCLFLNTDI